MLLFLLVYRIIPVPIFFLFLLFFFFILNKTASCKNKISSSSESGMKSKELQNPDFIFYSENLMTDISRIIVKYCYLSPSGNQAIRNFQDQSNVKQACFEIKVIFCNRRCSCMDLHLNGKLCCLKLRRYRIVAKLL